MFPKATLISFALLAVGVVGQQVGSLASENHPAISWQECSEGGSCTTKQASVVLDANWRWCILPGTITTLSLSLKTLTLHSGSDNCYTGNTWDQSLCPDAATCAQNCALDGADYSGTYGITTSGDELSLRFVTNGPYSTNIGSRVYLMDESDSGYQMFSLLNKEFTFDVDMSALPCGASTERFISWKWKPMVDCHLSQETKPVRNMVLDIVTLSVLTTCKFIGGE
ncbi:hypothetical protein MPER_09517, partial [Moniliophthora perniciosa FA553]